MKILHTWWSSKESSLLNVRFVRNEEGKREAQQINENEENISQGKIWLTQIGMTEPMQAETHKDEIIWHTPKKERWILIIGHIGHTQTSIIELLNMYSEKIDADVVTIKTEMPEQRWSLETLAQERREQVLISIEKTCKEMSDIFFEARRKPQYSNIHYTPKTQKAKIQTRKHIIPRKK